MFILRSQKKKKEEAGKCKVSGTKEVLKIRTEIMK